jgi:hypothetical protein
MAIRYILHGIAATEVIIRPQAGVVATFDPKGGSGLRFTLSFADADDTRLVFDYQYASDGGCIVEATLTTTVIKADVEDRRTVKTVRMDWARVTGLSFVKVLGINNTVVDGVKIDCLTSDENACENPVGGAATWNWPTVSDERQAVLALRRFQATCRGVGSNRM